MKCANARIENDVVHFDCPHCGGGLNAVESQVQQVWAAMQGQILCMVDTCQKPIILPTIEEVALLKASSVLEAPASEPAAGSRPEELQKAEEPAEDKKSTEVAGASPAPKPAPAPKLKTEAASDPQPESAPVAEAAAGQEVAAPDSQTVAPTAPTGTKPDIVHGFSGAADVPMTLEQEATSSSTMTIKTIRHSDCVDGDKDTFDEKVTGFLREQGDGNIISVSPIQFADSEKKPIDYGVLIIFKEDLLE